MSEWQWFVDYYREACWNNMPERRRMLELHDSAFELRETDPDRTLDMFTEGRQIAEQLGDAVLLRVHIREPKQEGILFDAMQDESFPRDMLVYDADGDPHKLTEVFVGGPEALVDIISSNFGVSVNHYAEVSVTGFMGVVETLGSVEICLDDDLYDRKHRRPNVSPAPDVDAPPSGAVREAR